MKSILLILLFSLSCMGAGFAQMPVPMPRHNFTVIAHRGDHTELPENTLQAYAAAIKDGADYVEIDLRTTTDGRLISLHDAGVERMTGGSKGLVKDLSFAELKNLQIKSKDNTDTTIYRIPSFEEILKLCQNKIYIYIDFKEATAAETLAILKQYHMERQVLVYINKASQYTDWRNTDPGMPLMLSMPDEAKTVAAMQQFISNAHPDVLDGSYANYTMDMVLLGNSLAIPVWPDGQSKNEDFSTWDKAIALGLKGLQTDNPSALIYYLKSKGLR